jgi:hypothetical protein
MSKVKRRSRRLKRVSITALPEGLRITGIGDEKHSSSSSSSILREASVRQYSFCFKIPCLLARDDRETTRASFIKGVWDSHFTWDIQPTVDTPRADVLSEQNIKGGTRCSGTIHGRICTRRCYSLRSNFSPYRTLNYSHNMIYFSCRSVRN